MKKVQFYLLLVIYTWLAVVNMDDTYISSFSDLFTHFSAYIVLMNSCLIAYGTKPGKVIMFILLFLYSLIIEIVQYFIPYRDFSLLDLLANGLGLITGLIVGLTVLRLVDRFTQIHSPMDNMD